MASGYTWRSLNDEIQMFSTNRSSARIANRAAKTTLLSTAFASIAIAMPLVASAQDNISKFLLIKMARENSGVLCKSEAFTECMGFTAARCDEIKEEAINTCLEPLPDSINPDELKNDSLEACPRKVYKDAGFPEEKAKMCFDKAMEELAAPTPEKPAGDQ